MATKTYAGLLCEHCDVEDHDGLFVSSVRAPLASALSWMRGKQVTIRYWITDKQVTKEEAQETFLKTVMGIATDVTYYARYSEATGYLWTDEYLKVGGHDLLTELRSNVGKWLILEIEY
jgi:hypothetical protein